MSDADLLKREVRELVRKYAVRSNLKAFWQVINTLGPYVVLFYLSIFALQQQLFFLFAGSMLLLVLFIVRVFMVMHDCGHTCMFRTQGLNKIFGFVAGVIVGMPQYVWSKHHDYHHSTNGNWQKYRGPLSTLSITEYEGLSSTKKMIYRRTRHLSFAVIGAFLYFIFNPRFNWLMGTAKFVFHITYQKIKDIKKPAAKIIAAYRSPHWGDSKEYWHMAGNNIALLSIWFVGSFYFGLGNFFIVYLVSLSLAGAIGIVVFTIQHNFEESYAHDDTDWNFFEAALYGTSFLTFPKFFHWFGLNISYHHVHHLSSFIPNYNLKKCHEEYEHLFQGVKRIRLRDVPDAMKNILWDTDSNRIISIKAHDSIKASGQWPKLAPDTIEP